MAEPEPKKPKFDNSLDAWSFRFGMVLVACMVLWLFFMMFLAASINFQCSVTEFFQGKCNRFDRKFVPWDKLEKQRRENSSRYRRWYVAESSPAASGLQPIRVTSADEQLGIQLGVRGT